MTAALDHVVDDRVMVLADASPTVVATGASACLRPAYVVIFQPFAGAGEVPADASNLATTPPALAVGVVGAAILRGDADPKQDASV